ncbi:MAG: phospholipase [Alphaproteobacteria bacterium]|nr:phospholipase [Alphaproteobacteria bacterium]MCB9974032.1 phospholipase [Rhodospirillales bacterium]
MTEAKITNFYTREPLSGTVRQIVILLHGVGSNGRDLIALAPYWQESLPDALFISPDAPFRCDMVPPGYPDSYQWFSLLSRDPQDMLEGVRRVAPILETFMREQLEKADLVPDALALVGFSQGTMTALHVGPRFEPQIAGIVGYSGALLWEEGMEKEINSRPPVLLVHGEADDVVPVTAWFHAKTKLEALDFSVGGFTCGGLPHSIDQKGIQEAGSFLESIFIQKT